MPIASDNKFYKSDQEKLKWVSPIVSELRASDTAGKLVVTPEAYTVNGADDPRFGPS